MWWRCISDVPVTESLTYYNCCETPYSRVTFSVHLQRKPVYYIINLLVPSIVFSVITIITLMLQPGCSDRIGLGLSTVFMIHNERPPVALHRFISIIISTVIIIGVNFQWSVGLAPPPFGLWDSPYCWAPPLFVTRVRRITPSARRGCYVAVSWSRAPTVFFKFTPLIIINKSRLLL